MSDDYKIQSAYEGGECHMKFTTPATLKAFEIPKPSYNLKFFNQDGDEVGMLDFNGPGLAFEGVANESAIVFMDWVSQVFQQRLKDEYDRGFAAGKAAK